MRSLHKCLVFCAVPCAMTGTALSQTTHINFETIPGSSPSAGLVIDNQFNSQFDVDFSLQGGGFPVLAEVGDGATVMGFVYGPDKLPNTLAPGQSIGSSFFLTANGLEAGSHDLLLTFPEPVEKVTGDILDIDHADGWTVQAHAADGSLLDQESFYFGSLAAGDGVATPWQLSEPSNEITSVSLIYTGSGTKPGVGWGDFSITTLPGANGHGGATVPLPPGAWMAALLIGGIVISTQRSSRRCRGTAASLNTGHRPIAD
jgi:hypothetical protein